MPLLAVLEVVMQAFFFAQALQEVQVALGVLHTIVARRIGATESKAAGIALDAMLGQQALENLRNALLFEDAAVATMLQPGQRRAQLDAVVAEALAALALLDAPDQAMQAVALIHLQPGRLAQQRCQVQIGSGADQPQVDGIRLTDGFPTFEGENLEIQPGHLQGEAGARHRRSLSMKDAPFPERPYGLRRSARASRRSRRCRPLRGSRRSCGR